ncbi:MAG: hypothetical protein LBE53_14415 [Paucimonas sp.]|jgi:hypothetical protein|nr:hypothetical protein [Paucimonas sp.]
MGGVAFAVTALAFWSGLFQDLIKPLAEHRQQVTELKQPLAVELKTDRTTVAQWAQHDELFVGEPDLITLLLNRVPVKTLEITHTAKDQRFRDYPATAPLTYRQIPTRAQYQVTDLDGDGIPEVVLTLTNQLYSLHDDQLLNVLILDPKGRQLSGTPVPPEVAHLRTGALSPYSAYRSTGVMKDQISGQTRPVSFANGFVVERQGQHQVLRFSWVVDSASYVGEHLHVTQSFHFVDGSLEPAATPQLYISEQWQQPWMDNRPVTLAVAQKFLDEHNMPSFSTMMGSQDGQADPPPLLAPARKP